MVTCPACHQDVEPAPLLKGATGWKGAARFCPTQTGPMSRCQTDLASVLKPDGTRLLAPPTEARDHELESSLQHRVCKYLDSLAPEVRWWRQSVGKAYRQDGTELWYGTPGQGDLLLCVRGLYCELELKSATGRHQPNQKKHERIVEEAMGRYYLVRSLREAVTAVEEVVAAAQKPALELDRLRHEIACLKEGAR